jgi:hypothetical protein
MNVSSATSPPTPVGLLGYGGLVPFIGLALVIPFSEHVEFLGQALVAYGAVILSFVGALHWGFAMTLHDMSPEQRRARFIWSVLPALIAWPSTLLPVPLGCVLLIAGFAAHYWQDRHLVRTLALPDWYLPLRIRLTSVASVCLLMGAIAVAIR